MEKNKNIENFLDKVSTRESGWLKLTSKEQEILKATKEFADTHQIPYNEQIESLILNAIRETVIQPSLESEKVTRYFFVTTAGKNPNSSLSLNNFDIETTNGKHPTFKQCIDISNGKFTGLRQVKVLSVVELSLEDWRVFTSEID